MTIPSTLSNILINGNTFDSGASTDGVTTTNFTYNTLIVNDAGAQITNNYFSGIQSDPTDTYMLILAGTNNVIGNTFVRGSSNILAYIRNIGTYDQMITNNIFDGYTVDGASNALVSGLTANSLYTNNKNQVGYAIIPLGSNKPTLFNTNGGLYNLFNFNDALPPDTSSDLIITSGYVTDTYVLRICDSSVSPEDQTIWMSVDISKSIPIGAKIIDAKLSIFNPSSIALDTTADNEFQLFLTASKNHTSAIDIKTNSSSSFSNNMINFTSISTLIINSGNESSLRSAYQVLEIPTLNFTGIINMAGSSSAVVNDDISKNYVNGNDYSLAATINFTFQSHTGGSPNTPIILVSPLIITYVF